MYPPGCWDFFSCVVVAVASSFAILLTGLIY
jgi:hypothetical protein